MKIIGAGLSGLLAANMLRKEKPIIYEQANSLPNNHTALLRHRDIKISQATSIPFREVVVRKAINYKGQLLNESNIALSNMYSHKVIGSYQDRSINDLKPVKRYIAPPDFIQQLAYGCDIEYNKGIDWIDQIENPIISTIPMPSLLKIIGNEFPEDIFTFREIGVVTFYINNCDLFQTVYYPNPTLTLYRLSITGNKITAEFNKTISENDEFNDNGNKYNLKDTIFHFLERDFGIYKPEVAEFKVSKNQYGKIKDINTHYRKETILKLTQLYGIYSLGRFAIWKNILLDDVHDDILIIKKLIRSKGYYTGD